MTRRWPDPFGFKHCDQRVASEQVFLDYNSRQHNNGKWEAMKYAVKLA